MSVLHLLLRTTLELAYSLQLSPPQCFSFDGLYSGIGFAPCSAGIIPTWACIKGPRSSAAIKSASAAACHSGLCCFALGSAMMHAVATFKVTRALPLYGIAPRASRLVELGLKVKGNGSGNELGNPDSCRLPNRT
jgi:hypothetical protein